MASDTSLDSADDAYPTFDEKDRSIFSIRDNRSRADVMQEAIIPKLREIAGMAFEMIEEVFGIDPLSDSVESTSPEHRPDATKTKPFDAASAGLVKRQIKGKYHYIKLLFNLTANGLSPVIEALRPIESDALFGVLRDYRDEILQILDRFHVNVWTEAIDGPGLSNVEVIDSATIDRGKQWWRSGLIGSLAEYPIENEDHITILIEQFVAMFPVYQAACERLSGIVDRFPDYFLSHLEALSGTDDADTEREGDAENCDSADSLNPELFAMEGEMRHALRQHRHREQWLREEKIQSVMQATGRLRCEVPGCGFDFFEVYGEIGQGFAHVHHLQPLGNLDEPARTRLGDLAIVCANCHSMIHRGGVVRPLKGLMLVKPEPSADHSREGQTSESDRRSDEPEPIGEPFDPRRARSVHEDVTVRELLSRRHLDDTVHKLAAEKERLAEKFGWGPGDVTMKARPPLPERPGQPGEKRLIAKLGVEGGGVTIFGRVVGGRWAFAQSGTSIALDADDNEEWHGWESAEEADLSAVVPDDWPLMYPIEIDPEFVGWFRDHYAAARASLRDDLRAYQTGGPDRRWQRVFAATRDA